MNQGHFFIPDFRNSKGAEQIIFRYTRVEKADNKSLPIYLAFESDSIVFYFKENSIDSSYLRHHEVFKIPLFNTFNDKFSINNIIELSFTDVLHEISDNSKYTVKFSEGKSKLIHYSNLIDKVKFSQGKKTGLWNIPDEIKEEREIPKQGNQPKVEFYKSTLLLDFLFDLEHSKVFDYSPVKNSIVARLRNNIVFNALTAKLEYYYLREQYIDTTNKGIKDTELQINKIVDGWSKKLTREEKNWVKIITSKEGISLLDEIKCRFYTIDEELKKEIQNIKLHANKIIDEWARRLTHAEKRWVEVITSEESIGLFNEIKYWFYKVDDELKAVLLSDSPIEKKGGKDFYPRKRNSISNGYFFRPTWKRLVNNRTKEIKNSIIGYYDVAEPQNSPLLGMLFMLKRYGVYDAFRVFKYEFPVFFSMIIFLLNFTIFLSTRHNDITAVSYFSYCFFFAILFILVCIIICFYLLDIVCLNEKKHSKFIGNFDNIWLSAYSYFDTKAESLQGRTSSESLTPTQKVNKSVNLVAFISKLEEQGHVMLNLYLLLSSIYVLAIPYFAFGTCPLHNSNWSWGNLLVSLAFPIAIIGFFIMVLIPVVIIIIRLFSYMGLIRRLGDNLNRGFKTLQKSKAYNLILPRLQIALVSGWILLLTTEELWKINYDVGGINAFITLVLSSIVLSFFISNEVNNAVKDRSSNGEKTLFVFLFSFSIACFWGIAVQAAIGETMLNRSGILQERHQNEDVEALKLSLANLEQQLTMFNDEQIADLNLNATFKKMNEFYLSLSNIITSKENNLRKNECSCFEKIKEGKNDFEDFIQQGLLGNKIDLNQVKKSALFLKELELAFYDYDLLEKHMNIAKLSYSKHNYLCIKTYPYLLAAYMPGAMFIGLLLQLLTQGKGITEPL